MPLLHHPDYDGEISPEDCARIAPALEELVHRLPDYTEEGERFTDLWRDKTRQFAAGCRAALAAGEPLDFH